MLKHIDPLLNADLLYALQNMGHGDTLAIVDANFPAFSHSRSTMLSFPGVDCSQLLKSVLKHFPLDSFTDNPMLIMAADNSDQYTESAMDFIDIKNQSDERECSEILIDRQDFYRKARECELIISTNDTRAYACLILQKGVIFD
ncbi:RbsD/FucU family protein [Photobacterium rosenbergii]|uniref:RbsD/FucU family protein n=1 Tax=Photobacterium rosenbergii TaxID=294936 RepID=UPI001C99326C|nr:RbsD/FucU domain-containing protein [Photobacterium rosenbergii]MBY5944616.1 hypothetical protein [Photobacterium rosenbergii]